MKLGVNLGYWGFGMGPQDQLQVVQEAERLGYDSVWAAEAGWATYRVVGPMGVSWDRGIVGPSKKFPTKGEYPSSMEAALGFPNRSMQMLDFSALLISSKFAEVAGTFSRAATAKQNQQHHTYIQHST